MRLEVTAERVNFLTDDGRLAGSYVHADPYKPHIHPLNSPQGFTLSLCSPHDHKHHRGLMYALQARDINFWEEKPLQQGVAVGRQVHLAYSALWESGEEVGFLEELVWRSEDGSQHLQEIRSLDCRLSADGDRFMWRWRTELRAARDLELVMSPWSKPDLKGRLVNYHGLGVRLRREFGCTGGNRLVVDGREMRFEEALGVVPREVQFHGRIDGIWPVPRAYVGLRQGQGHALFVMDVPFAFMSLGPTSLSPMQLARGEVLAEEYEILVGDESPAEE